MKSPGYSDSAPTSEVATETLRELKASMHRAFVVRPPKRSSAFPRGPVTKITYETDKLRMDWDSSEPNAIVSGQIYDATQGAEFVVAAPLEGQSLPAATINGKNVTPLGAVRKLATDPADPSGESSISKIVIPTYEGFVFEVDEGVYMSDDYLDEKFSVRELGDHEVRVFTSELSAALDAQV